MGAVGAAAPTIFRQCTVVGNGLMGGQWRSRSFYDLLVPMYCKLINLNGMTKTKPFVIEEITQIVSQTQSLPLLDKSWAVRSFMHHNFNVIPFTFGMMEINVIIYQKKCSLEFWP